MKKIISIIIILALCCIPLITNEVKFYYYVWLVVSFIVWAKQKLAEYYYHKEEPKHSERRNEVLSKQIELIEEFKNYTQSSNKPFITFTTDEGQTVPVNGGKATAIDLEFFHKKGWKNVLEGATYSMHVLQSGQDITEINDKDRKNSFLSFGQHCELYAVLYKDVEQEEYFCYAKDANVKFNGKISKVTGESKEVLEEIYEYIKNATWQKRYAYRFPNLEIPILKEPTDYKKIIKQHPLADNIYKSLNSFVNENTLTRQLLIEKLCQNRIPKDDDFEYLLDNIVNMLMDSGIILGGQGVYTPGHNYDKIKGKEVKSFFTCSTGIMTFPIHVTRNTSMT